MKRILSKNPLTGAETWMHHDGETIAIETKQDVTKLLDINRKLRNEFQGYKDRPGSHHHLYAVIPSVVITQWLTEYGVDVYDPDHEPRVTKLLNDPDWRHLRTTEGRI